MNNSCWPVITTMYNLPPWLCMRRKYLMLTMLISGPKQPRYDINIFLAHLIDDLKLFWEDEVECFGAYKEEHFTLCVVLLRTINDFPVYGNLCGCSVKWYKVCPICGEETCSTRLQHGKEKHTWDRKYLLRHHPCRRRNRTFDGKQEHENPPDPLSGGGHLHEIQ